MPRLAPACALVCLFTACLPNHVVVGAPAPSVVANGHLVLADGDLLALAAGVGHASFEVGNHGTAPLLVRRILAACGDAAVELATPVLPVEVAPGSTAGLHFELVYLGTKAACAVTLETNPDATGDAAFSFTVSPDAGAPLLLLPSLVDLGVVPLGGLGSADLQVTNAGTAPLAFDGVQLVGHPGFRLDTDEEPLAPGTSTIWRVWYESRDTAAAKATLRVASNDPATGVEGALVALLANTGGPCLAINPSSLAFGGHFVGTTASVAAELTSCGTQPLVIQSLALTESASELFEVIGPSLPLTLAPGEAVALEVRYTPHDGRPGARRPSPG
jgi:hypothetical protein